MERSRSLLLSFASMSVFAFLMLIFLWFQADRSTYQDVALRDRFSRLDLGSSLIKNYHSTYSHSNVTLPNTPLSTRRTETKTQKTSHLAHSSTSTGIYKNYWRTIDNAKDVQLKLFSAYFDDRDSPQVFLLGYENHDAEHKYYCVLGYEDRTVCSGEPAKRLNVNDDVDPYKDYNIALWGFYYICNLPSSKIPTNASISLNPDCTLNSAEDWLPVLNKEKKEKSQMRKFGVCIQGPVYDLQDPQILVEFMELHRALGAELITVYIQNAGPLVWKALQQYADEGLVDLINWNLTFVPGAGNLHYRGQSLLVNECLYRNMYRVEYVAMNDLDEVLVPQGNLKTWSNMLPSLEDSGRGAFLFEHTTFTDEHKDIKEDYLRCGADSSLKAIHPPRYMARYNRFSKNGYEKLMVKPQCCKKVSFHRIFGFVSGYSLYKVPRNIGMSYHYREPPLPKRGRAYSDERLSTLFPQVLEKVRERLCSLYVDV